MTDIKRTGDGGKGPPDASGIPSVSGDGPSRPDGGVLPTDGYQDAATAEGVSSKGGGPTSIAARQGPSSVVLWNSARITQQTTALARMAGGLYARGSRSYTSDARMIFEGAIDYLKTKGFDPEKKPAGSTPTDSQIATALLRGFNGYYSGMPEASRTYSKSDIAKPSTAGRTGGKLYGPFREFIDDNAAHLGLVGKKEPKARTKTKAQAPTFRAETVAHRILTAQHVVAEIREMRTELTDPDALDSTLQAARRIDRDLRSLGTDEATLTPKLRRIASRTDALEKVAALAGLRDDALITVTRQTTDFEDERIEQYISNVTGNVADWIRNNAGDLYWIDSEKERVPIDPGQFNAIADAALRNYIAIWLSEQKAGETRRRLEITETAFRKARLLISHQFASKKEEKAIKGMIGRLLHHVARQDAGRIDGSAKGQKTAKATAPEKAPARNIHSLTNLETVIGSDLIAELDGYYDDIRSGTAGTASDHEAYAQSFYELFLQYIRRARNEYGDGFGPDLLASRGLEPRFTKAIFLRVDGAMERFDDVALGLLIQFFAAQFPDSSSQIKSADEIAMLKPSPDEYAVERRTQAASAQRLSNFIPYDYGMSHRDYVYQVRGVGEPYFEEDFNDHRLGITWKRSLDWGDIRENPDTIGVLHWQRIVENWDSIFDFADAEGLSTDVMLGMPTPTVGERPESISNDLWDAYARWRVSIGRGEDVTVEPRGEDGISAMIARYEFLSEIAEAHGQRMDFLEYMATIYPPIARMLLRAGDEGVIDLSEPEPMHDLFYEAWSYMTWAQQVHFGGYEAYTGVRAATFDTHRTQEVIPEHWDARRYAAPKMSERLGIEREELIIFINGFLRGVREILPRVDVRDTRDARLSPELRRRRSRYTIKFDVVDKRKQSLPTVRVTKGADRIIDDRIRAGTYDGRISYLGNYLSAISALIPNASISDPQNGNLSVADLQGELETVSKEHLIKSSIYRDATTTSSTYSPDDIREVREFYKHALEGFAHRILVEAPITGTIQLGGEAVHFQLLHTHTPFVKDGHLGVAIGEIVSTSQRETWGNDLTLAVSRIKAAVAYLMSIGELAPSDAKNRDRIANAVKPLLGDFPIFDSALEKYLKLRNGDFSAQPDTTVEPDDRSPPPGSKPAVPAGPKLPRGVKWQSLFARTAEDSHGLTAADTEVGTAILRDYFDAVKYLYRRFWPHTLERMVEEHKPTSPADVTRAISDFLNGIGVPTVVETETVDIDGGSVDQHIAALVFEDYRDLFPQPRGHGRRIRLPLNEALVSRLTELHIENYLGSSRPDFVNATRLVHANIDEFNAEAAAAYSSEQEIPHDGLLGGALRTHIDGSAATEVDLPALRRALFNLRCAIGACTVPEEPHVRDALSSTGRDGAVSDTHIALLSEVLTAQVDLQREVLSLVDDPEIGIVQFFQDNYNAPHLDVTYLSELAHDYVLSRISGNLPIDVTAMAGHYVDNNLSQYPSVALQVANSYRSILGDWISHVRMGLGDPVGLAHMAIPSIEEDTDNPPVSLDDFRARIAADVDVGMTYQRLEQLETRYGYLAAFLGLEPDTGLELATATAYAQSIESAQGELDTELVGIIDRVADLHRRSHETYLSSGAELDLDGVDEAAAARRLAELEASWETMSGLQDEVDALSTLQERAATIIGIRNEDTAAKQATESLSLDFLKLPDPAPRGTVDVLDLHIRSAKALLSLADDAMLHNMSVVEDHMTSLESIRFQNAAAEELARVEKAKGALSELHDTVTAKSDEAEKTHTVNLQTLADGVKDIDGDRTNFVNAAVRFVELERAATAAADELSTEREGLEAKVEDTYRATRAARITFSEVGEQHGEALLGAIVELELLAKTAGETLTSSGGHHRNLLESISTARERLVAEEEKLSLTDPSLFTKPTSLSASIADDAFKSTKPSARHYRTALSTLERITSAMILSTDEGSYLITPVDARTINTWRKTNRDEALQLTSVLGEEINIAQNTYGVNVTTPKGSYHLSPLANFVRVTRTLMQGRSNELILLADLIGGGGSSDHRTDLIAHLAHLGTSAQVKEVRATVRRWAIVNREHLGKKYFTKEEPLGVPRDGYDALAHANWHHLYDTYMTNPHMGMMVVRSGAPERKGEILWAGPVDMRDAHKGLEERREVYRYLHGSTGEWTEINIKEIAGLDERATFHVAPFYTTSVEGVLTLRTNWAMTHDPTLLDFGWIYQMANQSVEVESFPRSDEEQNFGQFVHGLLSPISNTPPGETSPLTLHDVQNLAVAAYHVAMNRPSPIRLADVSDRALMGWIESIPDKIDLYDNRDVVVADLRREMSDANFRGFMAKLYLIYHYSDDMDSEAIAFRTALAIATVRNAQILESSVRSIGEIFDRNTNTIYRNMHDPLFTPLDGDLVSAHPELKKVGRGQLFAALKILEPNMATKLPRDWPIRDIEERLARAPVWLKPMMQRLPSMANLLTIVGLTYSSLPREFRLKFKGLFHLCFDNSRIPDEATRRSLKERLQKLYATEAQVGVAGHDAIIRALGENLTEGFTLARWLTGEADPWVEKPNSLDDRTPADRIRMLAPELMKAREFILEFFHEKVTEDREVNRISEAMRDFYRRNVELRSALVMIYFVLMKMQEEHRHKIFSFFELPSGDQSPTLFARIATKDDMISEIRKALKEPFGEDDAESNAARLTGMEYPHLPLELLSPISRLAYMAPSVFRQKQSLVDAAFGVARGNEQLVNLISFATKHSEFRPAVAALSLAMLRYDRGKRFRIYNAFEGTPDLTSDGFIDILVEHGLLPEMDAVCGDNPISNEELLLPAFELDASGPLSQTHIEHRIDELGMLPKPFTHAFQKLVDAHIGQEAATYKDELIRGGKYTPNITDTAIRDHVGSLFKAACMAQKKVILLAKLIDPTEGFYDRMTKQSQRKMMAGIEDIPKDVDVINHLVAWYGYTFMIEHRDEVLTARDRILGGGGSSGSSGSPGSSGSSGPESSGGGGVKGGGETASGDSETSLSPSIGSTTMPITQHPFIGSPPFLTGAQKSTWYPGCQLHGLSAARFHAAAPTMLLTHANDNFPVGMTSTVMGASQFVSPINTVGLTAMRPIMPM